MFSTKSLDINGDPRTYQGGTWAAAAVGSKWPSSRQARCGHPQLGMRGGKAGTAGQREAVGAGPPARNEPESVAIPCKKGVQSRGVETAHPFSAAAAADSGLLGGVCATVAPRSRCSWYQPAHGKLSRDSLQNHWEFMQIHKGGSSGLSSNLPMLGDP